MAKPKGDYRQLEKLIAGAGRVASRELVTKSVRTFGAVSYELAQRGASSGQNPQGRRWKQLRTGGMALRAIAGTLRLRTRSSGFEIRSTAKWARYHQGGAKRRGTKWKLPARRILPKKSLPKQWQDPIVIRLKAEWYGNFR